MVSMSILSRYGGLVVHANQPFISTIIQGEARKGLPFFVVRRGIVSRKYNQSL